MILICKHPNRVIWNALLGDYRDGEFVGSVIAEAPTKDEVFQQVKKSVWKDEQISVA